MPDSSPTPSTAHRGHGPWLPDAMLALATSIWGASFALIKSGVADVDPLVFLALRFGGGALVYALVFHRFLRPTRDEVKWGLLLGVLLWSGNIMQTTGLTQISPERSAFLTALNVLGVPFLLMAFWRQRISLGVWMSVLLACAGLVVLYWTSVGFSMHRGDVLTLGCAAVFSGHILVMSEGGKRCRPMQMCAVQLVSGGLGMLLLVPLGLHGVSLVTTLQRIPHDAWVALAWLGTIGTVVPFGLQAKFQPQTTPTRAAVMYTMEPVFATIFAALLLGSTLSPRDAIGCVLLLLAVVVAEFKR